MARYHELDALRAFAMLLGVVLHAALFLIPIDWPGVAKEASLDLPYDEVVHAIHGFRMPVFFLLSGFFTAMLWERRGLRALIDHRIKRVGLPLLIGAFTIIPLQSWWWITTSGEELTLWALVYLIPLAWLYDLQLLWFLWVLLLLVGIFAIAALLGAKFSDKRVWWVLIPLVLVPQLLMGEDTWEPDTSTKLWTHPVVLGYYTCFFLFGAFMHQIKISFGSKWAIVLLPTFFIFVAGLHFEYESREPWSDVVSSVLEVAYAWGMCFGTMGLFKLIASKERAWVRYLSDASYWIYLWHLSLIFIAQSLVNEIDLNIHLEFLLIVLGVTGILLLVYHFGVRYTIIGTMLNGPRARNSLKSAIPTGAVDQTVESQTG